MEQEVLDRRHPVGPGQYRQQSRLSGEHPVPAKFRHLDHRVADAVATEYALYAQNTNDIYDGLWDQPTNSTTWQNGMGATGARQDIAPYPEWTALWLYTGDWRMRQVALGLADQAASWAVHIREGNPTKRFC